MTDQMVYMADLTDYVAQLEAAGTHVTKATEAVIHSMGDEVRRLASDYAPRGPTGNLARSIVAEHETMRSTITAKAPYAAFVEFGTWSHNVHNPRAGTYEIRPKNAKALAFQAGGKTVFAAVVRHPGIKPQPFMGPAADEVVAKFTKGVGDVGVFLVGHE
jgi:hypothetical protein